jgi:hypothetical protein
MQVKAMNIKTYILIIALVALSISCSSEKSVATNTEKPEVVIEDGYKTTGEGELVIEDKDLKHIQEAVVTSKENSQQNNIVAYDGSKISVMLDGFGNKSETRYFDNDPKLQMILLRTAANGDRQAFVYGQNGEVKDVPPAMLDKVMSLPASELAKAANIYDGKKERAVSQNYTTVSMPTTAMTSMQSLPVNQAQSQTQTADNSIPQTSAREETLARQIPESNEKNDSTDQSKTPTNLSENLKNYLPKKRKDVITDNE